MSIVQTKNRHNPFKCFYCNTSLPSRAVFCGYCGKQVKTRKNGNSKSLTVNGYHGEQGQNDDTVRLALGSQTHLKRHKSSHLPEIKDKPIQRQTIALDFPELLVPYSLESELAESELAESELAKSNLEDTQPRIAVPLQSVPLHAVPTTPNPTMSEIVPTIPNTEVPEFLGEVAEKSSTRHSRVTVPLELEESENIVEELLTPSISVAGTSTTQQTTAYSSYFGWLWPTGIILSTIAAYIVTFVMPYVVIRPVVTMLFLFICPGMVVVRFLRLKEPVVEWILAIALSFAIDAIVAAIQLYAGWWSPVGTLSILIGLSLGGVIVQMVTQYSLNTFRSS